MWNHGRVPGYFLTILVFAQITSNTSSGLQSSTVSSNRTNDLIKKRTQAPLDPVNLCTNCTKSDDDPNQYQQRKRRKRRRNRKPQSQFEQLVVRDYQRKKHSNRVRLDRPAQFWEDNTVPTVSSTIHPTTRMLDLDHFTSLRANNIVPDSSFITNLTTRAPPPVRYLLPPFSKVNVQKIMIAGPEEKGRSKFEASPAHRGLTKFKNTIYYKGYKENEIDTGENYPATSDGRGQVQPVKTQLKPIVVKPTSPYTLDGATAQIYLSNDKNKFVSAGMTNAGMQVIGVNDQVLVSPQYTVSETVRLNEPQIEKFQHRISETMERQQRTSLEARPSPAQSPDYVTPELNTEVDVPPPIQFTYVWEDFVGFNETSGSTVVTMLNSSRPNDDTDAYHREIAPTRMEIADKSEYQPQQPYILPENEGPIDRDNGYPTPKMSVRVSTAEKPVSQKASTSAYATYAFNSTTARTTRKQSSGKGLDLAETQYFSDLPVDLPSHEHVSSLFQNENQVIPGAAGKDYPIFGQSLLHKRRFACQGLQGYFADVSARCQVFYICNGNGAGEPMLCPNGTLFSQDLLVCDWWYNVDC